MAKFPVIPALVEISKQHKNSESECAEKFGCTYAYLRLIGYGHKKASPKIAAMVEAATEGVVTRKELRPDDWAIIWPEIK